MGPVLEAMGLRMGTSLVHLAASRDPRFADDPWNAIAPVLDGTSSPPDTRFVADIEAFRPLWADHMANSQRRRFAHSLSMLAIDVDQARRWWDPAKRVATAGSPLSDDEIVENPYVVSELDRGGRQSQPVSFMTVDRGFIAGHGPAGDVSPADRRRLRGGAVSSLRWASLQGDTLLGVPELRDAAARIPVPESVQIPDRWIEAESAFMAERMTVTDGEPQSVQLNDRRDIAGFLQRKLRARANRSLPSLGEAWHDLLTDTVSETSPSFDPSEPRVAAALDEQTRALEAITTRKASVLIGRAGTGKTTLLGALSRAPSQAGKVIFLAPTGKARVRLESRVAESTEVMTVAQYLFRLKRYDTARQEPIQGDACYDAHETIVVDESSMLTEDTLAALLATFTSAVKRLILVGDPAQLPPIGPGRPFADLVAHLRPLDVGPDEDLDDVAKRRGALASLTHEVRTVEGARSDTPPTRTLVYGRSYAA